MGTLMLPTAIWPLVTALTRPKCHRHSEAWDLFPTKALDFPGEQLLSLAARLVWRGALPPGGIWQERNQSSLPGAALDNSEGNGERGNV